MFSSLNFSSICFILLSVINLQLVASKKLVKDNSFEYMVFTQLWPKSDCININTKPHEVCKLNNNITDWTIHGIWPNNADKTGPFYCDRSWKLDENNIKTIENQLDKFWPNIITNTEHLRFWEHEWDKHGTCAASLPALNSQFKYFAKGLELNKKWNLLKILKDENIVPSTSITYRMSDIKEVIEKVTGSSVNVGCIKPEGIPLLDQIEICINKQFEPIDCDVESRKGKLVWTPSISNSVYPCSDDEYIYYLPLKM